jgi:hypothetical protein
MAGLCSASAFGGIADVAGCAVPSLVQRLTTLSGHRFCWLRIGTARDDFRQRRYGAIHFEESALRDPPLTILIPTNTMMNVDGDGVPRYPPVVG